MPFRLKKLRGSTHAARALGVFDFTDAALGDSLIFDIDMFGFVKRAFPSELTDRIKEAEKGVAGDLGDPLPRVDIATAAEELEEPDMFERFVYDLFARVVVVGEAGLLKAS